MKSNIFYIVSALKKCGPINQLYGIVENLDTNKYNVTILTLFEEGQDSDIQRFKDKNINLDCLNLERTQNYLKIALKVKKYFKNKNVDIIHSSGLAADFSSCFVSNCIHISTIRNYAYFDYISTYGKVKGNIMIMINYWAMKYTDYPVCCSKSIRDMYSKKMKKGFDYVQNGVNTEKYYYDLNVKLIARKKLNIKEDDKVFVVSGSLCSRKDPLFIINSFKEMKLEDNTKLIFIGDGDLYDECKKYESNLILIKGKVDNVNDYLNASDYYISASKSEGLPNSVLEAASCGIPVILSNIPQHKEIFIEEKEYVEYFELDNKEQFISVIKKVLSNKQKDDCRNKEISAYICDNFSSKKNSKMYSEIYEKLMKNDPSLKRKGE